jgi:hypothetical protein
MNNIKKNKKTTIALIKYAHVYKQYRNIKYNDYDLDFAVKCGVDDLFNSLKYCDKEYIPIAIENETNILIDEIDNLR